MVAETCTVCHSNGQLVDDAALHQELSSDAVAKNTATITSVTIPTASPIKPVIVFQVTDPAGALVLGLTSFNFTVAQLLPASTGVSLRSGAPQKAAAR